MTWNLTKPAIVYIATNIANGKRYIGVTCQSITNRKAKHFWYALVGKSKSHFHKAIRKYGKDGFIFSTVGSYDTYKEALADEIKLISELKPEYNITPGGQGFIGYKPTEEIRLKSSERMKGKPGYWRGKKLPEYMRQRWVEKSKRPEQKELWKKYGLLGAKSQMKKVVCLNDGKTYDSMLLAASAYDIAPASICAVCRRSKKRLTVGGLVFRYFGDHLGGKEEAASVAVRARKNQLSGIAGGNYRKAVICLLDGTQYSTVKDAAKAYGIKSETVIAACKNSRTAQSKNWKKFAYIEVAT